MIRAMPEALRGAPESVHAARVASRRVREALALMQASQTAVNTRKLLRRVRRVTRVLGRVRELDVGGSVLDEMAQAHPEIMGEVQTAKGWLAETRHGRAQAFGNIGGRFQHKLERTLYAKLEQLANEAELHWQPAIAAQVARRRRRVLRASEAAGSIYVPERLHAVRIAVKRLRYAVELAAELNGSNAKRLLASLRQIQGVLGRMHDLQVLMGHLQELDRSRFGRTLSLLEVDTRALHAQYLERREELRHAAAESHHRFCLRSLPRPRPARASLARRREARRA